tara:strand:- start:19200 stop:20522 length:1323 start_codon:yes stop_codon:yes gene_type:complete
MSRREAEGAALPHQYKFIMSKAKYPALVSGLGAGKTEALVYRTLKFLTDIPKARIGIYEPTVDLLKRIIYPRFEDIFANSGIPYKLNKSDGVMSIWMPSGMAQIIFRSMENPTRIIGYEVHHSILDEIDTLPQNKAEDVWYRVLARNRKGFIDPSTNKRGVNTVGITTTPEGFAFVYNMWVKLHADNPEYELIRGRTADNHHLPDDYVSSLRATFPPQLIDAYLEGKFVNLIGNTVYDGFDRVASNTNKTLEAFPESSPIHIGMDFNIGKMAAVIGMKGEVDVELQTKPDLYIVDEIYNVMDTPAMIEVIHAKFPRRSIIIYPDASGRSRKSIDASKSDIKLLTDAGFRISAPLKNPPVRERVLSLNTLFLNAMGVRKLFINIRMCKNLTEGVEKQVYDDNGVPVKDNIIDHGNDALGYLVNRIFGLAKTSVGVIRKRFA